MRNSAIQRAAEAAGSQSALARALGCRPQAVQRWCRTGIVPAERVLEVERISGIRREEIRPDLYPIDENLCCDISVSTHDAAVPMRKAG
ncbi:transcriptional regulator [Laribacter hongkongensis]|uniref:transcriptional regulator n=1 Tax=Laribacter hongkongensis TaxID=168471 RepID=UPI0009D68B6A|nr:YdaS family helix-turn-helix protein [Laribacter hongkongensis]MCG9081137.1 helix-turn-helix domain-containing protein [Laribacter hongkongensis]